MAGRFVIEVGEQDFQTAVIERSKEVPVLVDFWAPWCGPCQVLGPTLERLADEYAGGFLLAKVDVDANQALAGALQIQSIPFVVLVVDGKIAEHFNGALPESQIRAFLEPHVKPGTGEPGEPEAPEGGLDLARARYDAGDLGGAASTLDELLAAEPDAFDAHLLRARVALALEDGATAERHLDAIPPEAEAFKEADRLRGALVFGEACGEGEASWQERLRAAPDDLEALFGLGSCQAVAGRYAEALATFLEIVKRDKTYRDEGARKAMLAIFDLLGRDSELVSEYRRKLIIHL